MRSCGGCPWRCVGRRGRSYVGRRGQLRWLRVRKKRPLCDDQERVPGRPRLTVDRQNARSYRRQGSCTLLMCRVFRNDPVLHDRRPGPILAGIVMEYHRA